MKKKHRFLIKLSTLTLTYAKIMACPTCIGTIEFNSPKFFSDEAYKSNHHVQNNESNHNKETAVITQEEKK